MGHQFLHFLLICNTQMMTLIEHQAQFVSLHIRQTPRITFTSFKLTRKCRVTLKAIFSKNQIIRATILEAMTPFWVLKHQ
jgi:hypothetical protein